MEIKYRQIVLRDMAQRDIDDWIRWYNVETEWGDWDAPDEALEPVDPEKYRAEMEEQLKKPREGMRTFFELDTAAGDHIGMVTSYAIDEAFHWMSWKDARASGTFSYTLGLDICDSRFWGKGLGTQALAAFVKYFLDNGMEVLCLQTWSGNASMIRTAQKVGFRECNRISGNRNIRGGVYDSLTFRLDTESFRRYLLEENLRELGLSCVDTVLAAYDRRPAFFQEEALRAYSEGYPISCRSPLERLVIWGCCLTGVRERYQKTGIPYAVVQDTFSDIFFRAERYQRKTGRPGLSKEDVIWFRHISNCHIFKLGALQFQLFHMVYLDLEGCGEDYMTFPREVKKRLPPDSPVLNVHIPEKADLSPQSVTASFREAARFFPRYFPDHGAKAFLCYSWLLYPQMKALLPENSNILAFAQRFQIIGQVSDPYGSDAVRRIYGKRFRRKEEYPRDTVLQRNALGHFRKLGMACGLIEIT